MAAWVSAGREGDLPPGQVRVVQAGRNRLALCNVEGQLYCIDDVCTHDGGPLDQGELDGCEIECPRHGARFDVTTGQATCMPAVVPVKTYPVRVVDGDVQVEVDG
jgi:3-phenylpropionate/trans-cinnamate dioxygenase ferredoxin subunit